MLTEGDRREDLLFDSQTMDSIPADHPQEERTERIRFLINQLRPGSFLGAERGRLAKTPEMVPAGERYLTRNALDRALSAGRDVEHWLGARKEGGLPVLRWLNIEHQRDGSAILRVSDVFDDSGPEFLDLNEFSPYDPEDAAFGVETPFSSSLEALAHAVAELGANPERFVNEGFVYLDYQDYLKTREQGGDE